MIGFYDSPVCHAPGCEEWLTGRQARFCSAKCRMRAHRHARATPPAEKVCVLCGATFRPLRGKQTFCDFENDADDTCVTLQNERVAQRFTLDSERHAKTCAHCGEWAGWDGIGRPRRFCSNRCKTAHYRARA